MICLQFITILREVVMQIDSWVLIVMMILVFLSVISYFAIKYGKKCECEDNNYIFKPRNKTDL